VTLLTESVDIPLALAKIILYVMIATSFIAVVVWIFQGVAVRKLFGVDLKQLGELIRDIGVDIKDRQLSRIGIRIGEGSAYFIAYQARMALLTILFILLGEFLLIVNAAFLVKQTKAVEAQTDAIKSQTAILESQKSLIIKQAGFKELEFAIQKSGQFFSDRDYTEISAAIDQCAKLYLSYGGKFDSSRINKYLNFFEEIAYFWKRGFLSIETVNEIFGTYILEAYFYPEIKEYISQFRDSYKTPEFLDEFESLAQKLQQLPGRAAHIETISSACANKVRTGR